MAKIMIFDSTLRDGSHAIKHQLTKKNIADYCKAIDDSGVYVVMVGHGNGLGASSLQVGISKLNDTEILETARKYLKKTKLGAFLIPGFGTIKNDLIPAVELGVDIFCVASHCSEADVTRQHIEFLISKNKEVYGCLMMYHMISKEKLLEEAKKMQNYGVKGIIIMDSAGASTIEMVRTTIKFISNNLDVKVGFHSHNNLGLAVANAYIAVEEGASIIDGTIRGFGAGAGNCQLEAFIALMEKSDKNTGVDLYKLLEVSDNIIENIMEKTSGLSSVSIVSGLTGVFSSFAPHVKKAAEQFGVDPKEIFVELGKRKVVGGQEDVIIEIAEKLHNKKQKNSELYQLESLS